MSCQVKNPTLQAVYPLDSTLNIIRTLQPSLTPLPNTTAFGAAGTVYAQLFYAGVEQFYCEADTCTQSLTNGESGANWSCQNLRCTCRSGTTFCGGVPALSLVNTINGLSGTLDIDCDPVDSTNNTATCYFNQQILRSLFPPSGLALNGCSFGECVAQSVIDTGGNGTTTPVQESGKPLGGGVIAGLAVVGVLVFLALSFLVLGYIKQRRARSAVQHDTGGIQVGLDWDKISYSVPGYSSTSVFTALRRRRGTADLSDDKAILDNVSGRVQAGQMMAILGPSGAGKTTLVEILAGKSKSGVTIGNVSFPTRGGSNESVVPRIGFVPQQDVLPPTLTVYEALLFAARLRLPENIQDIEKRELVDELMSKLGISSIRDVRIGYNGDVGGGKARGISGGEMRRVSIGLELISRPDILILDEPTSGLDSVSASRIAKVLHDIAHDPVNPIPVIASIHQPSSQIYQSFDSILLLSHGRALYSGPGLFAPSDYFARVAPSVVPAYPPGYNVADYLLEVASDPHVSLFQVNEKDTTSTDTPTDMINNAEISEKLQGSSSHASNTALHPNPSMRTSSHKRTTYMTTFLTQIQVLAGREWKILQRDKTLFFAHVVVSAILGVFCGTDMPTPSLFIDFADCSEQGGSTTKQESQLQASSPE
ncbi:hypothetical protein H0H81_009016 [Sphagnurus paluster]|uniref:ABC transporter domain-containing protein n=1 Tax=Sphagnurus paluster TaxID=117069 RepID=A0A9P7K4H5_9AGAR|nr:hypothetical protein H0H81_009016 [Sphagnurus paluster]